MKFWNLLKKMLFWGTLSTLLILIYFFIKEVDKSESSFFSSIINGIISGIVTATIIFIFQIIWKKSIIVWFENLLYQDVCIEGEWSGFIVPHIGLKDIDKIQKELAWKELKKRKKEREKRNSKKENDDEYEESHTKTKASSVNSETGENEELSAEVIIHTDKKNIETENKKIEFEFSPTPIFIKAELKRKGHSITGRIIETGGASDFHTYTVDGTFKNLIFTANYESCSKNHIDRGALSLMLLKNGEIFEGFFSSYGDNSHRILPMECVLSKRAPMDDN